jgi:hypothetical protein
VLSGEVPRLRLNQWCQDASSAPSGYNYRPLFIRKDDFRAGKWTSFTHLVNNLSSAEPDTPMELPADS